MKFSLCIPVLSSLILMASISPLHAGGEIGNGGDAVVCYTGSDRTTVRSIELFDYWENDRVIRVPGGIQLGASDLSVRAKIELALSRVRSLDPILWNAVGEVAFSIADRIDQYLVTGAELPEIEDTNPRALPSRPCYLEQFAVQWREVSSGQRRFAISARFYNDPLVSNDTRAGIILHEAIYRQGLLRGHRDSDGARLLNYLISTRHFESSGLPRYVAALEDSRYAPKGCSLRTLPVLGTPAYLRKSLRSGSGKTHEFCLPLTLKYRQLEVTTGVQDDTYLDERSNRDSVLYLGHGSVTRLKEEGDWVERNVRTASRGSVSPVSRLDIDLDGKPSLLWQAYDRSEGVAPPIATTENGERVRCGGDRDGYIRIWLGKNQEIRGCSVDEPITLRVSGRLMQVTDFRYSESGYVRMVRLNEPVEFRVFGSERHLKLHWTVDLTSEGFALSGDLDRPLEIPYEDGIAVMNDLRIDPETQLAEATYFRRFEPALYQGKRVLAESGNSRPDYLAFCRKNGMALEEGLSTEVYVTDEEEFHDFQEGEIVRRSDERVSIIRSVICQKQVKIRL